MVVTPELVDMTRRMRFVESCTFTFAQYHNPIRQYMYFCTTCSQRVCIVCRVRPIVPPSVVCLRVSARLCVCVCVLCR